MKKLLLPLLLAPLGLCIGAAAGHFLKPPKAEEEPAAQQQTAEEKALAALAPPAPEPEPTPAPTPSEYVKLDRQFIVPVVQKDKVEALMVISMAIETAPGSTETVFQHEPKLRDEFLRVLFLHAQSGGFSGTFTAPHVMDDLREALTRSARVVLGDIVHSVLLTNVLKQDS